MLTKTRAPTAQLKLRLPTDLRNAVVTAAKERGVSMNTEIIDCITAAYKPAISDSWARPFDSREYSMAYLSILRGLEKELGSFSKAVERVTELHRAAGMNVDEFGETGDSE